MPVNMKEIIAKAVWTLLLDKKVKKLTVKDIVEECHITRQSFYYHFEDIPDLLQWMMNRGAERIKMETQNLEGEEEALKYFFLLEINAKPYIEQTIRSNYGAEMAKLLKQQMYQIFDEIFKKEGAYQSYSQEELELLKRYHFHAIIGILAEWTEEDTKNLDKIVHRVYLLLTGKN